MTIELIAPDWPRIPGVRAIATTRKGGASRGVYQSLNLGDHVGDNIEDVRTNRELLASHLGVSAQNIQWLSQMHGSNIHTIDSITVGAPVADAAFTVRRQLICSVMTADCLPVLFASKDGSEIAVAHAGWRGLQQGILEATVSCFSRPGNIQAWLGPAISSSAFEIGYEVRAAFVDKFPELSACFTFSENGKWHADLYGLARSVLQFAGVSAIYGGQYCTYSDPQKFFSYRRDGVTGRMATLIWRI